MAKKKRKGISPKTRFEVFKRDSFKCQYCGRSAPEVLLELDHMDPVSKDGEESILNYLTSCRDCNAGKGARRLSDTSEIEKQRAQLEELNERRNQLDMLLRWRQGLRSIEEHAGDAAIARIGEILLASKRSLTDRGRGDVHSWVKKYGIENVLNSVEAAALKAREGSTAEFIDTFLDLTERYSRTKKLEESKPYLRDLYYIRGILRRRLGYLDPVACIIFLEYAIKDGADPEEMKEMARQANSWSTFKRWVKEEWGTDG